MKLSVLTENVAGGRFLAEHGLSYLIESNGKTILFDTGHTDVFLKNAALLGINIKKLVDVIVLSHGHWDHGDGLKHITDLPLITHHDSFVKRFRKNDNTNIGLALTRHQISKKFKLIETKWPYKIGEGIYFLGEIPRINKFESQTTTFVDDKNEPDFVLDDSALAIIENNELIIVTGCSHSGICNIIEHAKTVSGIQKVKAVIGGFHLKHNNKQTQQTIEYFQKEDIKTIYPSHCTELPALASFYNAFKIEQLKTGMLLNF